MSEYNRDRKGVCSACEEFKNIRNIARKLCSNCYKKRYQEKFKANCPTCGQFKLMKTKTECDPCYRLRLGKYQKSCTFQIDSGDHKKLMQLSIKQNISIAELLRTYVVWGLENDV